MSNETLFFICGGILAASAVTVSVVGLKAGNNFPGKWMPVIIIWFAAFAVLSGTFAVLHGKDESRDHDAEYSKASEEIQKSRDHRPVRRSGSSKSAEEEERRIRRIGRRRRIFGKRRKLRRRKRSFGRRS